jgi:hypothetical protein
MRFPFGRSAEELISDAAALLELGFEAGGPIVIKEPRISGLLPYWRAAAARAGLGVRIAHIFRRPDDVAASLYRRDGLGGAVSDALWMKYNLVGERDGRNVPRVFVSYEDIMTDWRGVVTSCAEVLGLDLSISSKTRAAVAAFLSPGLRHHASLQPLSAAPLMSRLFALLIEAKSGRSDPTGFDAILVEYLAQRRRALEERLTGT